jgi:hypothetical protein
MADWVIRLAAITSRSAEDLISEAINCNSNHFWPQSQSNTRTKQMSDFIDISQLLTINNTFGGEVGKVFIAIDGEFNVWDIIYAINWLQCRYSVKCRQSCGQKRILSVDSLITGGLLRSQTLSIDCIS